ncbi:winged helix-turn-helix transcriptional regulator [Mycolicibacterium austroafricanum]|uniref:Winged helix-turn-helix transcriptional regulator n=2 Tax=Mycolicibacterium TaxID=1866885 RepID=A0ABT8HIU8_MYCAO|nr:MULTISPECIES: winged helix-turn-helix transcriptional regulator [Mycolicibacterium]MDN4520703.1 winged helix-turn-helix transcriptional regulator [Mycolicibacterium austroafricanum]MDW5614832.1 winged helix-turn-helix transcriptional regulator [Mycolicibacterium sp. D5.8-2]PQP43868.1 transcriptional regulator [Mycolicibacterium austroafricanum]QRZ10102.1 helix-turn-helix transcriptional regulator [Mycolicibacterium austroafricanum]QZT60162.1 winged helix-turn-helix transcriptional regulator
MLSLLGDEWTLLIVQRALLGARRYGDFAAALPVSNTVLSGRLQSLTADGLLVRSQYQSNPPRSEYLPTSMGRSLWPMLTSIWEWERRWVPEHAEPLPRMHHATCGRPFQPVVTCRACDGPASGKDVAAQWGPSGSWERSIPSGTNRRRSSGRRSGAALLFPQTMSVVGDRWAFALLVAAFVGVGRFTDFQAQLGAPPATIADRLSVFTDENILGQSGGRYGLTEKGLAFFPVLVCALAWAQRWFPSPEGPAVLLTHTACDRRFAPVLVCDQCGNRLRAEQVLPVS